MKRSIVRHNGVWMAITPKAYEPERQTSEIAWAMMREPGLTPPAAYREWYAREQEKVAVLYPAFRNNKKDA